jgi:chemotaxis protein histidine kinase CheA
MKLSKLFVKEVKENVAGAKVAMKTLQNNPMSVKAAKKMERCTHTLKGIALQQGVYSIAYLAKAANDLAKFYYDIKDIKARRKALAFIDDFTSSAEMAVDYELKKKKLKINPETFKKIDAWMKKEYKQNE